MLGALNRQSRRRKHTGPPSLSRRFCILKGLYFERPGQRRNGRLTLCVRSAGHNGCIQCMTSVQARRPECPLCRAPFNPSTHLTLNHQLRDLVALANSLQIDEQTRKEGWDAFPTARATVEQYSSELSSLGTKGGASTGVSGGSQVAVRNTHSLLELGFTKLFVCEFPLAAVGWTGFTPSTKVPSQLDA